MPADVGAADGHYTAVPVCGAARQDRLEGYACIGVASVIIFQVIINVGMCLFVMPVIGLTLPFISYGGSSLVMLFACMGLVSGVHGRAKPTGCDRKDNKERRGCAGAFFVCLHTGGQNRL